MKPSDPFLFKLHSPRDYIVGGGFFACSTLYPISLAWDAFQEKNGASSLGEMRARTEKYRRKAPSHGEDYQIGCILLQQPFFLRERDWIPVPSDWKPNIVQGKSYDTNTGLGKKLWEHVQLRLQARKDLWREARLTDIEGGYGPPQIVMPRLGQGSFRILVTDVYQRRCSVTQERTLPALDAVHIKPFGKSGPHSVNNGVLFRSDIHKLFDAGYVTISKDCHFEVRMLKPEYHARKSQHNEVLALLAEVGKTLGFKIWIGKKEQSEYADGLAGNKKLSEYANTNLNNITNAENKKTIQTIDLLWIKNNRIASSFEIEFSTSMTSALVRGSNIDSKVPKYLGELPRCQVYTIHRCYA